MAVPLDTITNPGDNGRVNLFKNNMKNELRDLHLAFIGCGVMGESMAAGLLRKNLVDPKNITASHPRENRRDELVESHGIAVFASNRAAAEAIAGHENSAIVLCVKPQRLTSVLNDLNGVLHPAQLVISIVAGATIEHLAEELGTAKVVRAMPNTPSQIGAGITAWTCTVAVNETERGHVRELLSALGKELFVETENMIDMATSLSATPPTTSRASARSSARIARLELQKKRACHRGGWPARFFSGRQVERVRSPCTAQPPQVFSTFWRS